MTNEHLRGPWQAILSQEVDISIRRGSALPDEDGSLPGSYRSGDAIELWDDMYVEDGDPTTDADARWAQAQAMAAGLNAAGNAA